MIAIRLLALLVTFLEPAFKQGGYALPLATVVSRTTISSDTFRTTTSIETCYYPGLLLHLKLATVYPGLLLLLTLATVVPKTTSCIDTCYRCTQDFYFF